MNRHTLQLAVCIFMVFLTGCDGGLVGTSTGPTVSHPEVPRLPKKISPLLPKTIKGGQTTTANTQSPTNSESSVTPQTESKSWSLINPSLQEIESTRIAVQEILTLLDTEFDSILHQCLPSLLDSGQCKIDAGSVEAIYNDDVTRQMIAIHTTANAETPSDSIIEDNSTSALRSYYHSLEGSSVIFNELTLNVPLNNTADFTLTTSTDNLLKGNELLLRWNSSYDQITYQVSSAVNEKQAERYNYRNNATGQRLTVQRDFLNTQGNPDTYSFEFTSQPIDIGEVYYNARVDDYYISGQADSQSAYAYTRDYDTEDSIFSREVFDEDGYLIAFHECTHEDDDYCDDLELDEDIYELFISTDDLDVAEMDLGFSDVAISGLPADVVDFLILENDPDIPLWLREEFCEGWQPFAGEVELFCFVPNSELEDAVVVSIDGDEPQLLPEAKVLVD